jgi:type IV fimbrial biogenesis protein FimT
MLSRCRGFSLYELLITLGLAAVLLTLGVPSFAVIAAKNTQDAEINALFHAVHQARKESIMRRKVASLCPTTDGRSCRRGKDWSTGWILFNNIDGDSPPAVDEGETILLWHRVAESARISANRQSFTLRATLRRATNGTLVVCDRAGRTPPKALVVSYTGRPRVALEAPDGSPYSCPDYVKQTTQ